MSNMVSVAEWIVAASGLIGGVTGSLSLLLMYFSHRARAPRINVVYMPSYVKGRITSINIRVINCGERPVTIDHIIVYWKPEDVAYGIIVPDDNYTEPRLIDSRSPATDYAFDYVPLHNHPEQVEKIEVITITGKKYVKRINHKPLPKDIAAKIGVTVLVDAKEKGEK